MNVSPAELADSGFGLVPRLLSEAETEPLATALEFVFARGAGQRALLGFPEVAQTARLIGGRLSALRLLQPAAPAIQAIAFNKTAGANWKVAWHQDLQFPFAGADLAPGCSGACRKDGIAYGQPPAEVLAGLLAVRVHLDDCDDSNGPLRVLPGTHRFGVLDDDNLEARKAAGHEVMCLAALGDALLMRPLLLHASSAATAPRQRRVLHFVFAESPLPEPARWVESAAWAA